MLIQQLPFALFHSSSNNMICIIKNVQTKSGKLYFFQLINIMQSIYNNKLPYYIIIYTKLCVIFPQASRCRYCCRQHNNSIIYTFRLFIMSYDNNSYCYIVHRRGIILLEANGQCFFGGCCRSSSAFRANWTFFARFNPFLPLK